MTPEQALNILNQVSSQALLSRDNHEKVLVAVDTLKKLIEDKPKEKKK